MAWASGGLIPASQRGTTLTGLIHICDWYHTFSILAGVDPVDHKAAANGLPPTDGGNVWPALAGYDSTAFYHPDPVPPRVLCFVGGLRPPRVEGWHPAFSLLAA